MASHEKAFYGKLRCEQERLRLTYASAQVQSNFSFLLILSMNPCERDKSADVRIRLLVSPYIFLCRSNYALTSNQAILDIALDCSLFIEPIAAV